MPSLETVLSQNNLSALGSFVFDGEMILPGRQEFLGLSGVLIGNIGPHMWRSFKESPEYSDQQQDPMNRWTKRVLDETGQLCGASGVLYPFDRPYWPFQRFLGAATRTKQSPVGQYIHPEYGLWFAVRGVLIFPSRQEIANLINPLPEILEDQNHPCETCIDKPCLSACPVGAFDGNSLKVDLCHSHLAVSNQGGCLGKGCLARSACPVGREYVYDLDQIQFHMRAYFTR